MDTDTSVDANTVTAAARTFLANCSSKHAFPDFEPFPLAFKGFWVYRSGGLDELDESSRHISSGGTDGAGVVRGNGRERVGGE